MNILVSGAALLLACTALAIYDFIAVRETMVRNLSTQAEIIGTNSISGLVSGDPQAAKTTLGALRAAPNVLYAAVYRTDGRLLAEYRRDPNVAATPLPPLPLGQVERYSSSHWDILLVRRIMLGADPIGIVFLRSDSQELITRLQRYSVILGTVLLVSFVAALAVSHASQQAIAGPITDLAKAAQRVTRDKDYSVRVSLAGAVDYETALLVNAFNDMLAQIDQHERTLVAAQNELEERVKQRTSELDAANQELEAFSYSVSHDLRAPLRHVVGFATLLAKDEGGLLLDSQNRRYLETLTAAAQRMGTLIDDLIAFSRTSRAPLDKQSVSLSSLVREAQAEIAAQASGRTIVWKVNDGLPQVNADPALLRLVLVNLLSNAVKYTGTREVAEIEVGTTADHGEAVVFVRDNGVGFDMQYVHKLFGVFQRLHRQDEFEGTGIGLANVRRIINRHGGRTWAEAQLDRGATFYFSLPTDRT